VSSAHVLDVALFLVVVVLGVLVMKRM